MKFVFQYEILGASIVEGRVMQVIKQACREVGFSAKTAVALVFISDAKMRKLNRKYRHKDKTTNVLAFAATPHPPLSPGERTSEGRVRDLGDIFISLPEAKREAKKYGWTLKYEIARLALHGFLHLLGYDHIEDTEARRMEKIESSILKFYA